MLLGSVVVMSYFHEGRVVHFSVQVDKYLMREVESNPQRLGYLFPTFSKIDWLAPYKQTWINVQFK